MKIDVFLKKILKVYMKNSASNNTGQLVQGCFFVVQRHFALYI